MLRKYINSIIDDYMHEPKMIHTNNKEYRLNPEAEVEPYDDDVINFSLAPAVGGRILRTSRRNKHGDRENQVYVIPSGEDVGERVAKILNLELIK